MAKQVEDSPMSVRFKAKERKLLKKLAAQIGVSRADVLRLAIRALAEAQKVK